MTDQTPDVESFDLDAWIDGATTPAKSVVLYRNLGRIAEYERLEKEFLDLQAKLGAMRDDDGPEPDVSLAENPIEQQISDLAQHMKDVYEALHDDALTATVRGLGADKIEERRRAVAQVKDKTEALAFELLVHGTEFTSPDGRTFKLDQAGIKKLRNAVGEGQFNKLVSAASTVNGFTGDSDEVMPDFWPGASAILEARRS